MRRTIAVVLLLIGVATADELRKDRWGDPLPRGVTTRFGTVRMRHDGPVHGVAFSSDGKHVATAGEDRRLRTWEVATGRPVQTFEAPLAFVHVAFAPDGLTLLATTADRQLHAYDLGSGLEVRKVGLNDARFSLSADGERLATTIPTGAVVREVATGRVVREVSIGSPVDACALSPDGRTVATGSRDDAARTVRVEGAPGETRFGGHAGWVTAVAFTPDGKKLVTGSADRDVHVTDLATGKVEKVLSGHEHFVTLVAVAPDGRTVATASDDETVRLWDVATGRERLELPAPDAKALAFSPDGRLLATGRGRALVLWEVATGREVTPVVGHELWATAVAFSPDGRLVASASGDRTVRLWDPTGREVRRLLGHEAPVSDVAFSLDGKCLATACQDAKVKLWDAATGRELATLEGHKGPVTSLAFGGDVGRAREPTRCDVLVTVGDSTVRVWDLATNAERAKPINAGNEAGPLALARDGRRVAVLTGDRLVRVFDVATGRELARVQGQARVHGLALAGDLLALAGESPGLLVWDLAQAKEVLAFADEPVAGTVALSGDGTRVAIGRSDRPVRVLEVPSGKPVATLEVTPGAVAVALSPDGRSVVWATTEGVLLGAGAP